MLLARGQLHRLSADGDDRILIGDLLTIDARAACCDQAAGLALVLGKAQPDQRVDDGD